ncbi:MAG: HAD-IIIA family hydrolase [Proteobacteria bacterium]|nr:HAD-IIIA family hydrolase [Pseudomonadota bacterium]
MEHYVSTAKIYSLAELIPIREQLREAGRSVIYTSGVFDLLHIGHVRYLEAAKKLGDILIVGVNSDASVQALKGPLRPIVSESERAALVSGLASVDFVFIFSDRNNNSNISALKPDIYAKAGDYSKEKLSSASIVESYGGRVELIRFEQGFSSTDIISRIVMRYGGVGAEAGAAPIKKLSPAVFLDRDGTINEHVDYLSQPDQFTLIPGVIEALQVLQKAGYHLIVTTNQPGIGLGYFTRENLYAVNRKFFKLLSEAGVKLDKFYFCPHSEAEGCGCRKPAAGMIQRACQEMPIELEHSFVVGDTTTDLQFAQNAGVRAILVETGIGGSDRRFDAKPSRTARNLLEAARFIASSKSAS